MAGRVAGGGIVLPDTAGEKPQPYSQAKLAALRAGRIRHGDRPHHAARPIRSDHIPCPDDPTYSAIASTHPEAKPARRLPDIFRSEGELTDHLVAGGTLTLDANGIVTSADSVQLTVRSGAGQYAGVSSGSATLSLSADARIPTKLVGPLAFNF